MVDRSGAGVRRVDVLLALAAGLVSAAILLVFPSDPPGLVALDHAGELALTAVAAGALVVRRARPVASALAVAAVSVVLPNPWIVLLSLYAAGAHVRRRAWLALLVPAMLAAWFVSRRGWVEFRVNDQAFPVFVALLATLAGVYVGTRRALLAAAHDRADRAEREQHLLAEAARAEERAHLAAEMHDVVTHRVNLMVLRAGALGVRCDDPDVRDAAEELRASGCAALAELRDLVGVLRSGDDPAAAGPAPGSGAGSGSGPDGGIEALVEESRGVGVAVDLDQAGDPAVLAPTVHRTLLRVVQESLTNARKHAPGAPVRVVLRYGGSGVVGSGVVAEVANGPAPAGPDPDLAGTGGGTGLAGLRRRVGMVGGSVTAGPGTDGGFVVRAELPAFVPVAPAPRPGPAEVV